MSNTDSGTMKIQKTKNIDVYLTESTFKYCITIVESCVDVNEKFQQCLKEEGLDTLSYIQKCINDSMKGSLGEKKIGRK